MAPRSELLVLSPELRQIGKNVDNYASREKRSHENAKEKAKDKRKNARSAARNNEAKAAAPYLGRWPAREGGPDEVPRAC